MRDRIVDFDLARGLLHHVGMRGTAAVVRLQADRLYRLLRRYLGADQQAWNPEFRAKVIDHLDVLVRFDPTTIVARDQSYFAVP